MSQIRAVNLGGWLVLERWMRESLFEGVSGQDETQFCLQVPDKKERLEAHRASFITEDDFKWIADHGLNTVRLPYPYWLFGDDEPYVGCVDWLDKAMDWAAKYKLQVLLDLHTAPGCQNGFDNGGQLGVLMWHTDPKNLDLTIDILIKVAQRYKGHPALWGMQVLNEPHWTLPIPFMEAFYERAYAALRAIVKPETAIVFHDAFRNTAWENFLRGKDNVILDMHLYQAFDEKFGQASLVDNVEYALHHYDFIQEVSTYVRVIIGEWSLGIDPKTFESLDDFNTHLALRTFASSQLLAFEKAYGWVFWNYKIENYPSGWNFRRLVDETILPPNYR